MKTIEEIARGITVCSEWLEFDRFVADMGHPPKGMSIDRIDNNKGYFKQNCRWATPLEQQRNTRITTWVVYSGVKMPLALSAEKSGINRGTLYARYRNKVPMERLFASLYFRKH